MDLVFCGGFYINRMNGEFNPAWQNFSCLAWILHTRYLFASVKNRLAR